MAFWRFGLRRKGNGYRRRGAAGALSAGRPRRRPREGPPPGRRGPGAACSGSQPRSRAGPRCHATVPLPKPRPPEAPAKRPEKPEAAKQAPAETEKQSRPRRPRPRRRRPRPAGWRCRKRSRSRPAFPTSTAPGGCGGEDLVRLEAVVLPDKHRVAVKPAAILRCTMASAIADWIRTDMAPLAASLGSDISDLDNFNSFECRGRNRVAGAQLSEHGRANALDVRGFRLANGQSISLTDRNVAARTSRERAAFGVRAVFHGAGAGLGLVSRGPHPSRPDGAAQQLQDLPVERVGSAAAGRAAIAGRAAGGSAAARGRRQNRCRQGRCRQDAETPRQDRCREIGCGQIRKPSAGGGTGRQQKSAGKTGAFETL